MKSLKLIVILIISQFLLTSIDCAKITVEQEKILNEVGIDEAEQQAPYIGGYNSDKAEILLVNFIPNPELYKPDLREKQSRNTDSKKKVQKTILPKSVQAQRTFKEMVKDNQEILLTGGIHTNIFKSDEYQITIAVNDKQTMKSVMEFWLQQEEVQSVRYKKKTYFRKGQMPQKIKEKQKQEMSAKQEELKKQNDETMQEL
eukprot:403337246